MLGLGSLVQGLLTGGGFDDDASTQSGISDPSMMNEDVEFEDFPDSGLLDSDHQDFMDCNEEEDTNTHNEPKRRGKKISGSRRKTEEQLRALLQQQAELGNLTNTTQGRRSRRMRPIDGKKELVVLFPNDDPISALQLEKNEIPEFVCCMEEKFEWVSDEENNDDHGHGKGYGGQASQSNGHGAHSTTLSPRWTSSNEVR